MNKKALNIYISGMGGQGIAFLARLIIEACIEAGQRILSCDTHGMAQRGGIVKSHLRIGACVRTPMIPKGKADICLGLERLEAMRAVRDMAAENSTAVYYDSVYQPSSVRTGAADYPSNEDFQKLGREKSVKIYKVYSKDIPDPKMQNTAVLAEIVRLKLIPALTGKLIKKIMNKLLPESIRKQNMHFFDTMLARPSLMPETSQ